MNSLPLRSVAARKSTPFIAVISLCAFAIAISLYLGTDATEKARLASRYTARVGFPIFMMTYMASSLVKLWKNPTTISLMRNRFYWGMAYFVAMTIHLTAFSVFLFMPDNGESLVPVYIGNVGIALIYAMGLTPLNAASRSGTLRWVKRLHGVGQHVLWVMYVLIYFTHLIDARWGMSNLPLFILCISGPILRIAAWFKTHQRSAMRARADA